MAIDFSDPRPAYVQIADDLRGEIKAGRLKPGDRLPARKDLGAQYQVSPETVKKAQDVLGSEGLVSTHSTRGTFVLKEPEEQPPSPEFVALMGELRQLHERVEGIDRRLQGIEEQRRAAGR